MGTRRQFIELVRRDIYGGQPSDDAEITPNLVNVWLDKAIGIAAQTNYTDSIKLDGISYINGSFYTTYKALSIVEDELFLYKITLPHIPFGIGSNEGVSTCVFKGSEGQISQSVIWINQNQKAYYQSLKEIPNKLLGYAEGEFIYIITPIILTQYTATVCMISGGDSTNLDSTLNVPSDYHQVMIKWIREQLMFERSVPKDNVNDGVDGPIKTI